MHLRAGAAAAAPPQAFERASALPPALQAVTSVPLEQPLREGRDASLTGSSTTSSLPELAVPDAAIMAVASTAAAGGLHSSSRSSSTGVADDGETDGMSHKTFLIVVTASSVAGVMLLMLLLLACVRWRRRRRYLKAIADAVAAMPTPAALNAAAAAHLRRLNRRGFGLSATDAAAVKPLQPKPTPERSGWGLMRRPDAGHSSMIGGAGPGGPASRGDKDRGRRGLLTEDGQYIPADLFDAGGLAALHEALPQASIAVGGRTNTASSSPMMRGLNIQSAGPPVAGGPAVASGGQPEGNAPRPYTSI
jgi:hypothetical protein